MEQTWEMGTDIKSCLEKHHFQNVLKLREIMNKIGCAESTGKITKFSFVKAANSLELLDCKVDSTYTTLRM